MTWVIPDRLQSAWQGQRYYKQFGNPANMLRHESSPVAQLEKRTHPRRIDDLDAAVRDAMAQ